MRRSSLFLAAALPAVLALTACGRTSTPSDAAAGGADANAPPDAPSERPAASETTTASAPTASAPTASAPQPEEPLPVASAEPPAGATSAAPAAGDIWQTGTVTLLLSDNGPVLAEVIFQKNRLVRIDFKTTNVATNAKVQKAIDDAVAQAKLGKLTVKYHTYDGGKRSGLHGAQPKPGEPQFARAINHWLSDHDFDTRVK